MNKFFYGWYFRCQSGTETVAVIPAVHISNQKRSCSVQVITEKGTWNVEFPIHQFRINRKKLIMKIGENVFSKKGMYLNLKDGDTRIRGVFQFHGFVKPKYDIMGPFRHIPMMECRHAVYSLQHLVNGHLWIGSKKLDMENAKGYMAWKAIAAFRFRTNMSGRKVSLRRDVLFLQQRLYPLEDFRLQEQLELFIGRDGSIGLQPILVQQLQKWKKESFSSAREDMS